VHIIAHSMGGLDARHMLYDGRNEGFHDKIASVTTIGTPHLGTSFADWGIRHTRELFRLFEWLGIDSLDGFRDLTTEACRKFDDEARGFETSCGVSFRTVAGVQDVELIFAPLQFSWFVIHEKEGANDGLVPVESARWRPELVLCTIDADHLNQVGWWDPNELGLRFFPSLAAKRRSRRETEARIRALYVEIARGLDARPA
jgi:triacylglycerol lipase